MCANCLHIERCAITWRNIYSEKSRLTILKPRAHIIVIQTLETLLWLRFVIASSVSEVHVAPVVFEESTNRRVCSGTWESCKWNTFIRKPRLQEGRERGNLADSGLLTGLFREERIKQNEIYCEAKRLLVHHLEKCTNPPITLLYDFFSFYSFRNLHHLHSFQVLNLIFESRYQYWLWIW